MNMWRMVGAGQRNGGVRHRAGVVIVVLATLLVACGGDPATSPIDGASPGDGETTAPPTDGPDPDEAEPAPDAQGCDASHVFWGPDGIRQTFPDLEDDHLVDADRTEIEDLACQVAERIEAAEPPMDLFESLVTRYTSTPDPASYRDGDWAADHGRYGGLTPAQCAAWSVVSTLIANADEAIIGDPGRLGPENHYVRWTGRCDG
jgi:hypothetical protein